MSEEHDSWFKDAFGVDLNDAVSKIKEDVAAAAGAVAAKASEVVQGVQEAAAGVTGGTATVAKKAAAGGAPSGGDSGDSAAGGGSFPIGGSVGRGGQNAPDDVRAVQGALGISADGQCGSQTISAIEAFQRNMGMANPDGRVDPGGATERALTGGAKAADPPAAPAPEPATPEAADEGGILDRIKKGASEIVDEAKDFGEKVVEGAEEVVESAKRFVEEEVLDGPEGGSPPAAPNFLPGIGLGGQFTFEKLGLPPDPGFPLGDVAFGQFAGKFLVKFKPTLLSLVRAPKPAEAEPGLKALCTELCENASFKWFGGITVKGDTKSAGVAASFLKMSMKIGDVTLEFKAFEIGLDLKKIVRVTLGSTSANFPAFEHELSGVTWEISISVSGSIEVSPNPAVALRAFIGVGQPIIEIALVAGMPLAVGAVIGIGIAMAGEQGARDAAILEAAEDARRAAFAYASTMTGSEGIGSGPRARAAVAVAKDLLANVAASRTISLEQLMTELRQDKNQANDFGRIHAQARNQIFAAFFAEIRRHLRAWREAHPVFAAFTTESDDIVAVDRKVSIVFER